MSFKRFEIPPRFHDLPMGMRRASLCADLTSENVLKTLLGRHDLDDKAYDFIDRSIDAMIENAIGTHPMPLGVVPNFCVDGTMHAVAMATEEPSVIAGFNRVSRVFNASGGTLTSMPMPMTAAQIAIAISPQNASHLLENLQSRVDDWRTIANDANPALVAAGGGVVQIDFEMIATAESARCHCTTDACFATLAEFDPIEPINEVLVVATLHVSTRDAMGANAVNAMAEALQNAWFEHYGKMDGYAPCMAIVSNRAAERNVHAQVSIPEQVIEQYTKLDFDDFSQRIDRAMRFANASPARAVTHNKGILNGIVAAATPLGQDTRAICASAIDAATRTGIHKPLTQWFGAQHRENGKRYLVGSIDINIPVGFVGGMRHIPHIDAAFKFDHISSLSALSGVLASVGLAQNFAALWALVTDGIQAGHIKLHDKKKAIEANGESPPH